MLRFLFVLLQTGKMIMANLGCYKLEATSHHLLKQRVAKSNMNPISSPLMIMQGYTLTGIVMPQFLKAPSQPQGGWNKM
jgi:hypothetical protein